jgi:hypothetical protein
LKPQQLYPIGLFAKLLQFAYNGLVVLFSFIPDSEGVKREIREK